MVLEYKHMSEELRSQQPELNPSEITDADIEKSVDAITEHAVDKEIATADRAMKLEKIKAGVRDLEKGVSDRMPGVLAKEAGQMLEIKNFAEPADFDKAVDELIDRMFQMLEPNVAAAHTKLEMRFLVEAAMLDALKKKIHDTESAEIPEEPPN